MIKNHRESDQIRFMNCFQDAGDDVMSILTCHDKYAADVESTNKTMKVVFAENHKQWL
mgnify:CR=1